jgi:hypothetical protein
MNVLRWQRDFEVERERNLPGEGGQMFMSTRRRLSSKDMELVETRFSEPQLHYEFVPGLTKEEESANHFFWYWMLRVSDDVGTRYRDDNGAARGPAEGGPATHATRDLGGDRADSASRLVFEFEPPSGWQPPDPWHNQLVIDLLRERLVIE